MGENDIQLYHSSTGEFRSSDDVRNNPASIKPVLDVFTVYFVILDRLLTKAAKNKLQRVGIEWVEFTFFFFLLVLRKRPRNNINQSCQSVFL